MNYSKIATIFVKLEINFSSNINIQSIIIILQNVTLTHEVIYSVKNKSVKKFILSI